MLMTGNRVKEAVKEKGMKAVFALSACVGIGAVLLICLFLLAKGIPPMAEIGVLKFLFGSEWRPSQGEYGILPMIIGSLYVTAGAVLVGVPLGILCSVFLVYYCPKRLYKTVKPAIELMAGIPSIVYGYFSLFVIVPMMQSIFGGSGSGIPAASLTLGIMILPTVIGVSESALRAAPGYYYEGALALGATHETSIFKAVFPAASSGIMAGVILGIGRAIGETMALVMVAGNSPIIPNSIKDGIRTLTANIVMEMGYAEGLHQGALFSTAVVLFVFVLMINIAFSCLKNTGEAKSKKLRRVKK